MTTSNNDFSHFDRIEAYLFDTMSSDEKAIFETELKINKDLAEQLKTHQLEHMVMRELRANTLRQEVSSWQKPETRIIGLPRRQFFQWVAAATVLSILSIVGLRLYQSNTSGVELSNQLFNETLPLDIERSKAGNNEISVWTDVNTALSDDKPNYNKVLSTLDKLPLDIQSKFPDRIALLRGRCQYRLESFNNAAKTFEQVMINGISSDARQEAEWARILCLLALDKNSETYQQALKNLVVKPSKFRQQAETLLSK